MRPKNQPARDQLASVLARRAAAAAADLAGPLGVSIPTLHRLLKEQGDRVVTTGKARRTRHALRRELRGTAGPLPVYEVDPAGRAAVLAPLSLVRPEGSVLELRGDWPVPPSARDGWWASLPYPLATMQPQGRMGRRFALSRERALGVPPDLAAWRDDDLVHALSHAGSDAAGSLIVGDRAFEDWQAAMLAPAEPLNPIALRPAYAQLAERALAAEEGGGAGDTGWGVGGEFPKFAAMRERSGSATPHVIVKFSGTEGSATVRRWADLLVAEHLALECAADLPGVARANSRVLTHAGRTFLEVERIDRDGLAGRRPVIDLATLAAAWLGRDAATNWRLLAAEFEALGLVTADTAAAIERLWWYARLIGETDPRPARLNLRPAAGRFELASICGLAPTLYAPLPGGELPARVFKPALPLPAQRATWAQACFAAITFWERAALDPRIGESFRPTLAANGALLRDLLGRV